MNNPLDNLKRSKTVTTAFFVYVCLYGIAAINDLLMYINLSSGKGMDYSDFKRVIYLDLANLAVYIFAAITFIQWFRRAYHNLHKAQSSGLTWGEGWAAGAWWVPIVNLFRPYQIMKEIWEQTKVYWQSRGGNDDGLSDDFNQTEKTGNATSQLIGWWWAAYIIAIILESIGSNFTDPETNGYDQLTLGFGVAMVADIAKIIALLVAIKMIKESQFHQNKFLQAWRNNDNPSGTINLSDSDDILD